MTKNNYLSRYLLKGEKNRQTTEKTLNFFDKLRKQPVWGYAIFGIVLILMQVMSDIGVLSPSFMTAIGSTLIFCIIAIGFCLLLGYSALASLGTAGFVGIGAYAAYFCMAQWGLTVGLTLIIAILAAVIIGIIVGYISLRIEGIYLAIVTLGVAQIIKEVLSAIKDTIKLSSKNIKLFGVLKLTEDHVFYILVLVLFVLMFITHNLMDSPTGRAMLAMKNSTSAAQAFGISLLKYRLLAFIISIIYASIAGMLFMMYSRYVSNSSSTLFTLSTSLNILGAVIIGGTKSIWGSIGGTFIIYGIDKMFLQDIPFFSNNPTLITIFCGVLVIVVVMFYPGGLAQLVIELKYKISAKIKKSREAKYGKDIG